jgi:serine/threonine-protein kinase
VGDEDSVLIVMEYVDGESLSDRLRRGRLPAEEALSILRQVGEALDHAHLEGVVHRDVKPSNILLAPGGVAKLADLGIATAVDATAITGSGAVIGTLAYIAPERLRGRPADAAADVYSLAAVAFEMLSGRRALPERSPTDLVARVESGPPNLRDAMPEAPAAAAALLERAMDADSTRRPGSAGALVAGLAEAFGQDGQDGQTYPAPRAAAPTQPREAEHAFVPPPISRRRGRGRLAAPIALAAAAAILIAVILLAAAGPDRQAPKMTPRSADRLAKSLRAEATTPAAPVAAAPAPQPAAPAPEPAQTEAAPPAGTPPAGADGAALNDQGFALIQQGRYSEAVPILQQAVDSFPSGSTDLSYAYALFNLGNALRLAGRPEEAIPVLERRLEIPDQTATVRRELELAKRQAGQG